MTTTTAKAWFNPNIDFIGAIGVDTEREFADAIRDNPDTLYALGFEERHGKPPLDVIIQALSENNCTVFTVRDSAFDEEIWHEADTEPLAIAEPVPDGRVKVFGVHL